MFSSLRHYTLAALAATTLLTTGINAGSETETITQGQQAEQPQPPHATSTSKNLFVAVLGILATLEIYYGHEAAITMAQELFAAHNITLPNITLEQISSYVQNMLPSFNTMLESISVATNSPATETFESACYSSLTNWCKTALPTGVGPLNPTYFFDVLKSNCDSLLHATQTGCSNITEHSITQLIPQKCHDLQRACQSMQNLFTLFSV